MAKLNGGEIMARALKDQGVEYMFGIVGFPVHPIVHDGGGLSITGSYKDGPFSLYFHTGSLNSILLPRGGYCVPVYTGGSSASATTTSRPATSAPTATESAPGPLVAHLTHTYGGLKDVVNLPSGIPRRSRPTLRFFSDFLHTDGRTTARNKLDPSLSDLASADVVKYLKTTTVPASVQGVGSVTYTISKVQTSASGFALITGCLDQSKLAHVRKGGSHFVADGLGAPARLMNGRW